MNLNLRRLKCFVAVAEQGHFGRAAELVALSKTALSEQVRLLEDEWGLQLFDRHPRGVVLTPDGAALLEESRRLLMHSQALLGSVAMRRRPAAPRVHLGFGALAAGESTTRLIGVIQSSVPGVEVRLTHLSYARQVDAVLEGEVDASIVRGPIDPAPGLRTHELGTEPRMIMVSAAHPLASCASVRVAELSHELRVTTEGVPERWRRWWSLDPTPEGTPPPYGLLIHSWEEQMEAAASSIAMSIVPATAARIYNRADVAFVPITDAEPCSILLCSREAETAPWLDAAVRAARKAWSEARPA